MLAEKSFHVRLGATVVTSYGPVVRPADFPSFEPFMAAVQAAWDAEWAATMAADPAALPPLAVRGDLDFTPYPWSAIASQLAWAVIGAALLALSALWAWRGLAAATAALGPSAQHALAAAAAAWFVASLVACYERPARGGSGSGSSGADAGSSGNSNGEAAAAAGGGGQAAAGNGSGDLAAAAGKAANGAHAAATKTKSS